MSNFQLIIHQQKKSIRAYGFMCLILIMLIGSYTYLQFNKYEAYKEGLATNEDNKTVIKDLAGNSSTTYLQEKPKFTELQKNMEDTLKEVFPIGDNYTELTRSFDTFEQQLNRPNDPFLISSIDYGEGAEGPDGQYKFLPIRMSITGSRENFMKFLRYMETSGSLSGEVRLMDIQAIRLNINEDKEAKTQMINFSVSAQAYFQNI